MKRITICFIVLLFVATLAACADLNRTQQKTLTGAAIGAGGGALLGEIIGGRPFAGAAIGAAIGGLGGYVSGESDERHYHRNYRR